MLVDLHLHSCFSDGTRTPEQIADELQKHNIGIAALTDHNTCAGYDLFANACNALGIVALRGIELDCVYNGSVIHVLGYGFAPEGKLMRLADHSKLLLLEMSRDLVRKMSADFPYLSLEDYDRYSYDETEGGWKGLHYLRHHQIIRKLEDGMRLYSQYGCDYSEYPFPSVAAVCSAVREAGGVPILAHPANWFADCKPTELTTHLDNLLAAGIGGVECYYPSHSQQLTATCLVYCGRHNLLVTSGSDCHGGFVQVVNGIKYHIGASATPIERVRLGKLLPRKL